MANGLRGGVKGVEARDEDVGQDQQAGAAGVLLVKATQDAGGHQLADGGPRNVDRVVEGFFGLGAEELDAVREEAVDGREVVGVVEAVDEGADDLGAHAGGAELVERVGFVCTCCR